MSPDIGQTLGANTIPAGRRRSGHPYFFQLLERAGELHERKNYDYAQGGRPLGNFERVSAILRLYPGLDLTSREAVCFIFMLKQLDAYLWMKANRHNSKTGEGLLERLHDVFVYCGIEHCMEKENAEGTAETKP